MCKLCAKTEEGLKLIRDVVRLREELMKRGVAVRRCRLREFKWTPKGLETVEQRLITEFYQKLDTFKIFHRRIEEEHRLTNGVPMIGEQDVSS